MPCNQFGNQEPGESSQIQEFCELNFGVTFLLTEKINVKGSKQHPIYNWLTSKDFNGKKNSSVKWNFQKYLVNEKGIPRARLVPKGYGEDKPATYNGQLLTESYINQFESDEIKFEMLHQKNRRTDCEIISYDYVKQ